MLGQTSGVILPHQHEEKKLMSLHIYKHLVFDVRLPGLRDLSYLVFICGTRKNPSVFSYN